MDLVAKFGRDDLAILYVTQEDGKYIEFVESLQPPIPREKKWVIIISTMYGCPVRCEMCDAGTYYHGKIPYDIMLEQIDYIISKRYPERIVPVEKLKIQ
ncbi:MAG: radical SAM protein, partial [Candidatus Heimdallarchaeota archaeon]